MVSPLTALFTLALLVAGAAARAGEADITLPALSNSDTAVLWMILICAIIALVVGWGIARGVSKLSSGSASMQEVQKAIHDGAIAYLKQQVKAMSWLVLIITVGLFFMYHNVYIEAAKANVAAGGKLLYFNDPTTYGTFLSFGVALAFLLGVTCSYIAGYAGMNMAVKGNARVANQALTTFKGALECAFKSGAVAGMVTVGMGLAGAAIIFMIFKQDAMKVLVGFGFGGSLAALFMRVGGGIFTKAADVGADLVGKVEAGIPEDDPRNAATIADNVGDNVGDCAGMAADVFESYEVTLVAAIILGAATATAVFGGGAAGGAFALKLVMYALMVRGVGVIASIIGIFSVHGKDDINMNPMQPISRGFLIAILASIAGFFLVSYFYMGGSNPAQAITAANGTVFPWWSFLAANSLGIALSFVIEKITDHFTGVEKRPVTDIANAARTGPATIILTGFAQGLESSVWSALAICLTIILSTVLFHGNPEMTMYGIALTGLGLLATTGFILAEDTYGPIADNANGIFEMSGALKDEEAKGNFNPGKIVARLDMVGNTTKALTKGFAIATAVIAAVALFRSFMTDAHLSNIRIDLPIVFVGALIGAAVPFLFSSFAINAVSRAAQLLIFEVRRQFHEHPGIMAGTEKPDYARCVSIVTAAAQKELISPGILAVATPVIVGFGLGAEALGGYLAGAILSAQLLAVLLSNSGGAWDNAKKKIEDGFLGGKGSEAHKAAVVGDTVGDPFKDTAGPALNPLIKVMNLVAVLMAPVVIVVTNTTTRTIVCAIAGVFLLGAIMWSKRAGDDITAEVAGQKTAVK
jgi:K(+)-stimulated pyrophosphate-energized sodium pump